MIFNKFIHPRQSSLQSRFRTYWSSQNISSISFTTKLTPTAAPNNHCIYRFTLYGHFIKQNHTLCTLFLYVHVYFSSVQFSCSVISDSLKPHESQHARPPCPSPTPGVHSDSRPSSPWCHPAISSPVVPFSSCPQSLQHQSLFQWVNSLHEVAKVLEFQL